MLIFLTEKNMYFMAKVSEYLKWKQHFECSNVINIEKFLKSKTEH